MDEEQYQKIKEYAERNSHESVRDLAILLSSSSKELKLLFKEARHNPKLHRIMISSHITSVLLEEVSIDEALGILEHVREGLIKTDKMFNEAKDETRT